MQIINQSIIVSIIEKIHPSKTENTFSVVQHMCFFFFFLISIQAYFIEYVWLSEYTIVIIDGKMFRISKSMFDDIQMQKGRVLISLWRRNIKFIEIDIT